MSCTVVAIPYALYWVVGTLITAAATAEQISKNENEKKLKSEQKCEDVFKITEEHFIEKDFKTPFMDKNLLLKTLEEHGVTDIKEYDNKISGKTDGYILEFEKPEQEKPYHLKIKTSLTSDAGEKVNDLSSEYAMNVQEDAYLHILDKLQENNMTIEEETVEEDNTIVLTINIDG